VLRDLKKDFEPVWNSKDRPIGSKKVPKSGRIRNKKIGLYFQIHKLIIYLTILGAKIMIWSRFCSI